MKIALRMFARDERYIAVKVQAMLAAPPQVAGEANLDGLQADQVAAVHAALASNVSILTGAPGTGKTYTIDRLIKSFPGAKIELAAPTGKAAKRMFELTGTRANTIHKLLEFKPDEKGQFRPERNEGNPIEADVVVLDETSMIDVPLFARFLRALPLATRLILVGDIHQLPAVGPGNILRDLIAAGVPSVELDVIKRQDAGLIIRNCHAIKNGQAIVIDNKSSKDFFWMQKSATEDIAETILGLVEKRLPAKYEADRLRDIQVITPLREKGDVSCAALNNLMQVRLNPNPEIKGTKFRVNDKVIQTKNDYSLDLINGDIGFILEADAEEKILVVKFENPEREVEIPFNGNDLELAYALTCHKYQGSEAKIVVIPIHKSQGSMIMQRNWLYTAISRAREVVVLVGQSEEVPKIVARQDNHRRFTQLAGFFLAEVAGAEEDRAS